MGASSYLHPSSGVVLLIQHLWWYVVLYLLDDTLAVSCITYSIAAVCYACYQPHMVVVSSRCSRSCVVH